jgi:hypothetical protein
VTDVRLLHGLRVASDIGLSSARVDAGPPDVRFIGEAAIVVPATLPPGRLIGTLDSPDGTPFRAISEDGGHWRLRFFDRCDVVVEPGGRTVRYWPHVDVDPDLLPIYLTGTVLAVVLMLRGHPVLHASAVEVDGKAVAFVGASGMGKSTLATAFCGQGAALITDDVGCATAHCGCWTGREVYARSPPTAGTRRLPIARLTTMFHCIQSSSRLLCANRTTSSRDGCRR